MIRNLPRRRRLPSVAILSFMVTLAVLPAPASAQIIFGQVDTFAGGTVADWTEGASSPNPPANIASGGPAGAGDPYLQNVSSGGGGGSGSKQIMFNQVQWSGNFVSAGVNRITADMANFGSTPLFMRVALRGGPTSTMYGSTTANTIIPDGIWRSYIFNLTAGAMTNIGGSDSLSSALSNVGEFRILSAEFGPAFNGDALVSTLGIDNIHATTVPEPSSLVMCGLAAAAAYRATRRRRAVGL